MLGRFALRGRLAAAACICGAVLLAIALPPTAARADCFFTSGSAISCTGTTTNYDAGSQDGVTFTVQPGATLKGTGGTEAFKLTSGFTGSTLVNNGTIDGLVDIISSGGGADTFTNNGVLKITDPLTSLTSHSLAGTNFIQTASGTFMARVDAAGFNDSILAFSATLAGRLVIVVQPGLYTSANTYTVVNSGSPIVGRFDSASVTSPFFALSVSNCTCSVDVTLTPIAFNAVPGLTSNQQSVADVLQNLYASGTPTGTLATFYSNLFAATSAGVFDQLSGAGSTAAQTGSFAAAGQFGNTMMQQGLAWLIGTSGGNSITVGAPLGYAAASDPARKRGYDAFAAVGPAAQESGRWRAWGSGFGGTRKVSGDTGSADQSTSTAGGAFGIDRDFGGDLLIGAAAGGSSSSFSVSDLSTSGHIDGGQFGVYGVKRFGPAYVAAMLTYAHFSNSTERTIAGIGTTETAKGAFDSDLFGGRLELGWRHAVGRYVITPFAAVEPSTLRQQAYTESSTTSTGSAGVLGLSYASHTTNSLPTFLGAQFDAHYRFDGGMLLTPSARLSWVHEFKPDREIVASLATLGLTSFTAAGPRAARDALRTDVGMTLALTQAFSVFASFNGEFAGSSTTLAGSGGVRVTW